MAEVSLALSAASALPDATEEPTPLREAELHPSQPVVENPETEDKKPPKNPQISFSVFGHVPGFTHFISQRNPSNPDKIFASALFAAGHGYPLFYPDTILELDDVFRKTRGISIRDGILNPSNQASLQQGQSPESFLPLSLLQESEICTTANYFPRGYFIASKGVKVMRHSEDPLSSERRGAFMILPEGATRHDISPTNTRAFDYIQENAVSWAHHFAQNRRYAGANGSPYLVTGVDKTSVCANLAFPIRPPAVNMAATYQDELLHPMESMSIAREATAD
ncbi:hypothetical protein M413DRAFT_25085 [Hebeloma cylindrosporum]|uniref:Uncharacterized protein n=1 Tax=Hebeloma cylindrosporum TaxID=76867 RepID=A0A0C2Y482_HEBCY|nr:hypothetical protein M413DRAFT_25085 [Hebeloma cylindrosporum h7]